MTTTHADAINALAERLDTCFGVIHNASNSELEQQAIVYAAFLTDLQTGKIGVGVPASELQEMMDLIQQFCHLIETELSTQKGVSA